MCMCIEAKSQTYEGETYVFDKPNTPTVKKRSSNKTVGRNHMNPVQPLVVIHDDEPMYRDMYSIACAYGNAATLIESHGEKIYGQ